MSERKSDSWVSLTQSVLLHGAVIGSLAYGFYMYKKPPAPTPTLAIEGTVVDAKDLQPVTPQAKPVPVPPEPEPPPPVEDVGPPTPSPEEQQKEAEQAKLEAQRQAEEAQVALEKKQAQEKTAAEQQARAEAEKKRQQEERESEAKRVAEAKRKAEEKRKADEERRKADDDKRRAEEARQAAESDLRKSLETEERVNSLRSSSAMATWLGQIAAKIQRAWLRPPSAKPGIDCMVYVTQAVGGTVLNVRIGECNGDAAVRESIEAAVQRAQPLPPPPDPALFDKNLEIRFVPND